MPVICYTRVEVNRQTGRGEKVVKWTEPRIKVDWPFEYAHQWSAAFRMVIKATKCAFWHKAKKFWHIPPTTYSFNLVARALRKAFPDVDHKFGDAFTTALWSKPRTVEDIEIEPINDCVFEPWKNQLVGTHAVGQLSGILLDYAMGSGKSKLILDAARHYSFKRVVVFCPASVVNVWDKQAKLHLRQSTCPHKLLTLGKGLSLAKRRDKLRKEIEDCEREGRTLIAVTNFEGISSPHGKCLRDEIADNDWDLAVIDESHRVKDWTTAISTYLSRRVAHKAKHRVCMSGTPFGKGPIDAFGQAQFIEPGWFGESVTRFKSRFCIMGGYQNKQIVDHTNMEEFRTTLAELSLKCEIEDVIELPPERDEERLIEMPTASLKLYRDLREEFIADCESGVILGDNVLTRLLRLQQITSGFTQIQNEDGTEKRIVELSTAKTDATIELMTDIAPHEPIVVFAKFVHDLYEVGKAALATERDFFLLGDGNHQNDEWTEACKPNSDNPQGRGPVLAVQIQAGGVGIDLTPAAYGIYYSLGFAWPDYYQSRARILRPGQTRPCVYYHLICPGTIDRVVYRALAKKGEIIHYARDAIVRAHDLAS